MVQHENTILNESVPGTVEKYRVRLCYPLDLELEEPGPLVVRCRRSDEIDGSKLIV
jgi:hypothetical protein